MKKKCLAFIFAVVCINYGYSNDTLLRSVNSQFIEIINKETFYKYFYPKKSYKKGIKHVTDDGFFINTGASFYSKDFFVQKGFSNNTKERFSVGLNFEIGNMYRAFWYDTIVIGVKVS